MVPIVFFTAGTTDACRHACQVLLDRGIQFTSSPEDQVTDLLLDIPSFRQPGILRSGEDFHKLINSLPSGLRVWGGKLPLLPEGYSAMDFLEDPKYLAANAAITADCALRLSGPSLKTSWSDSRVLIIGWGRIGKQLARMLRSLGASVTVCARKAPDRALLAAFGYGTKEPDQLSGSGYQVIFNTVPATVMEEESLGDCPAVIDLASVPGILGERAVRARGLPGIYAPETSGKLIADTILTKLREVN